MSMLDWLKRSLFLIAVIVVVLPLGCDTDSPFSPGDPSWISGVFGFDSVTSDHSVKLYWTTNPPRNDMDFETRKPPTVAKVQIEMSEVSPEIRFQTLAVHQRGGQDSLLVEGLENGKVYYFRVVTYDARGSIIGPSRPIATTPGNPRTPSFSYSPMGVLIRGYALSPSGSRIAAVQSELNPGSSESPKSDIFMISVGLNQAERITDLMAVDYLGHATNDYYVGDLSWAPDEKRLAYTFSPSRTAGEVEYRIWIKRLEGAQDAVALTSGLVDFGASWFGSQKVVFLRGERMSQRGAEVCAVNLGSNDQVRTLTQSPGIYKRSSTVHPLNGDIVVDGSSSNHRWLYRIPAEGGAVEPFLATTYWDDQHPRWSPDGRYLTFESDRSGHFEIWAWDSASNTILQLTRSSYAGIQHTGPQLARNGTLVYRETSSRYSMSLQAVSLTELL